MAISIIAHGWALTLLFHSTVKELGSVDLATNAISVNLETTDILDAMESAATKEAASSPAGAALKAFREIKEQAEDAMNSERPAEAAKKVEEMAKPAARGDAEAQHVEDEAEAIKRIKEAAARDETKRQAEETAEAQKPADAEEIEKTKPEKTRQSAALGGAGTTGAIDAAQAAGRVSASQGSILNYGASLRALISSNTPRNIRKAAIRLAFSIAPAGGLSAVSVLTSSGKQDVDKRTVELVRNLSPQFPPPPAGASEGQLTFNIEVVFR